MADQIIPQRVLLFVFQLFDFVAHGGEYAREKAVEDRHEHELVIRALELERLALQDLDEAFETVLLDAPVEHHSDQLFVGFVHFAFLLQRE